DRATTANMAPEYGSTCGIFPIEVETVRYLELSGRPRERIELVSAYARAQGLWRNQGATPARYSDELELDLGSVEPSLAGPRRPQDRVPLKSAKSVYRTNARKTAEERRARNAAAQGVAPVTLDGRRLELQDGAVLIAAITSCTNTSNPSVMLAAGLLARKARQRGLKSAPWVKTSLAPGSRVVTDYFAKAGLLDDLAAVGFSLVGYGCTTCIGNSGPLKPEISAAVKAGDLTACAVLSGNRNFEGRVHPEVRMNFLASPPLVVAYALEDVRGARVLALLGDSVTTDHISPAGNIARNSPAARYLVEHGVEPKDFNSYGARRGNHEVMMRGTFANIRLRNLLVPGVEGG